MQGLRGIAEFKDLVMKRLGPEFDQDLRRPDQYRRRVFRTPGQE